MVVFLNGESTAPSDEGYGGGALVFHRLVMHPMPHNARRRVTGETGLLVAFSAGVYHEVWPVTFGERYSVVTWFA